MTYATSFLHSGELLDSCNIMEWNVYVCVYYIHTYVMYNKYNIYIRT